MWQALIPAIASLAGTGASLWSSAQNRAQQQGAIDAAGGMYSGEQWLRQMMLQRQYELATAGQEDARGNRIAYDPSSGWRTFLSTQGRELLNRSDAINRMHDVETLGRGAIERRANYNRRLGESAAAEPLLLEMRNRYGAPSREGTMGAEKIAAATGASEAADNARGGFTAAALRTGTGSVPLQHTLASLDRGAATGQRTALANAEADGRSQYNKQFADYMQSKGNPYNMLATRASNTENIPFQPENISDTLNTSMLNRAARGVAGANQYAGMGVGSMGRDLLTQMGLRTQMPWGSAIGGLGDIFSKLYGAWSKSTPNPDKFTAPYPQDQGPGSFGIF